MQVAGQYLGDGCRMGRCPLEPSTDRLVFVSRDLFRRSQAASAHHDQQRLGYLRGLGLQPIHRRSVRVPKVRLAGTAAIARSPSMAPIAHHVGLSTVRIRTGGQASLLLLLWLVHLSPPTLYSITPF